MDAAPYDIRLASSGDLDKLRTAVRRTMNNPEGKTQRKKFADAIDRGELLVLTRRERDGSEGVDAFLEWHARVDGLITIRDAGSAGDEPNAGHIKRLLRELLRMAAPPTVTVKVEEDQRFWNTIFEETAGFKQEGREYSRPHWRVIWTWTPAFEAEARARGAQMAPPRGRR